MGVWLCMGVGVELVENGRWHVQAGMGYTADNMIVGGDKRKGKVGCSG